MGKVKSSAPLVFNSPFELGLRMVYLLCSLRPAGADLQKLVLLDYAIIYSGDLNGPPSLHTPVPFRGGELLSRRALIEQGLHLMIMRGLVEARADDEGITYLAGKDSFALVGSLASPYFRELEERCNWAAKRYANIGSLELTQMFSDMGHRWGAELENFELKG